MSQASLFVFGALMLLATPGPTNTLLATSGAVVGIRRSLRLLVGEVLGYLISICFLAAVIGPLWNAAPTVRVSLKICCGLYLVFVAAKLWRRGTPEAGHDDDLGVRKVFVTTLLNPKAAIFAFVVVPHLANGDYMSAGPYLAGTAGLIMLVGTGWITIGAFLRKSGRGRITPWRARRIGAIALVIFASLLFVSTGTEVSAIGGVAPPDEPPGHGRRPRPRPDRPPYVPDSGDSDP